MAELEDLARRHGRLLRRLEKITRISDGFQRPLRELNTTLREASRIDPLTGLSNRRDSPSTLTVSVGVAIHGVGETLRSLLRQADEAMYEAKHLGRNRVEVAPDPA